MKQFTYPAHIYSTCEHSKVLLGTFALCWILPHGFRHQVERIQQLEEEVEELSTRIIVMTHAGHDPAEPQQGSGLPSNGSPAGHDTRWASSKEVLLQEEVGCSFHVTMCRGSSCRQGGRGCIKRLARDVHDIHIFTVCCGYTRPGTSY